jgi:hypothetical protein
VSLTAGTVTTITLGLLTGPFKLMNHTSSKVTEASGSYTDNGGSVIQDDWSGSPHQQAAFHRAIANVTGNETLLTLLEGISGRTLRARIWRGLVDSRSYGRTLAEHEAIYAALAARDAALGHAAALLHVSNTGQWLREHLESTSGSPESGPADGLASRPGPPTPGANRQEVPDDRARRDARAPDTSRNLRPVVPVSSASHRTALLPVSRKGPC